VHKILNTKILILCQKIIFLASQFFPLNREEQIENSRTREMLAGKDLWWSLTQIPIRSRNITSKASKASSYKAKQLPICIL